MRLTYWGLTWLGVLAIAACSSDGDSLFSEGGSSSGTGGSTSTSSGEGGSSSTSSTSTSTSSGGGAGGSSSTSSTSTSTSSTSTSTSTSTTSTSTGGPAVDVPCTNDTCTGSEVCCVHEQNASQDKCAQPGQCGEGFVQVACNGPNDCPVNQICCGQWDQQVGYLEVSCQPTCMSTNPGIAAIVMCGDDPNVCAQGQSCHQSQWLPTGHSFCQ
ncbi:MAG: hypothetical protein JRI68_33890 [Deltaproteobacteria bacterium]|nr:hypothetical protein [Deltaproteobacteria bacterium]